MEEYSNIIVIIFFKLQSCVYIGNLYLAGLQMEKIRFV